METLMPHIESLSHDARTALLARIAYELTICGRDTYEVGTDNVLEPRLLRAYNELLHRVTAAVVQHQSGSGGYSAESILELVRSFGTMHNRAKQVDWALNRAFQTSD